MWKALYIVRQSFQCRIALFLCVVGLSATEESYDASRCGERHPERMQFRFFHISPLGLNTHQSLAHIVEILRGQTLVKGHDLPEFTYLLQTLAHLGTVG